LIHDGQRIFYYFPGFIPIIEVDFDNFDEKTLELFNQFNQHGNQSGIYLATLSKGDILYLPPLWFHHVTNINAGITVNIWSDPNALQTQWNLLWKMIPKLPTQELTRKEMVLIMRQFALSLFKALKIEPQNFVRHHIHQRYERIFHSLQKGIINAEVKQWCEEAMKEAQGGKRGPKNEFRTKFTLPIPESHIETMAMMAAEKILGVEYSPDIVFGDYIDVLAYRAVGNHTSVYSFLTFCF